MIRLQIQLTEEQATALRRLAHERHRSVAALLRDATDDFIERSGEARAVAVALESVGGFRSGQQDVSERHDDYLAEALEP